MILPFILAAALAPASGPHAMVATEQRLATQAGVNVLKAGGNAVDAAVAVGYALAVVDQCCGNIGGGGFMLVRMHDGRETFIDFRERAPMRATATMYLDKNGNADAAKSRRGYLAVGVPGTVMGLERARTEYGTMARAVLMQPAISLARDGFVFTQGDLVPYRSVPGEGYTAWHYGAVPRAGERVKYPQLAHSLELIAKHGPTAFYRGPIAQAIVDASNSNGGILSMRDFAAYYVDEEKPLHCGYHELEIISAPLPSAGGTTLCEILNIISPYPLAQWGWHSVKETHYLIEAERRAYADRNTDLGDPAFVHNSVEALLDPQHAAALRATIQPERATPSSEIKPSVLGFRESDDTTHYSIVDANGNAVAVTYTLNDWFGAGVVAPGAGFFLNDEMDDFTAKPGTPNMYGLVQGPKNEIAPGKRPLSSMTQTMVLKGGKLAMVTGSPGGSRITTITLETILNVFDFGMNVQQAVDAPRMHMQWLPDRIDYEPGAFAPETMAKLRDDGYTFDEVPFWGSAQAIVVDPKTGMRYGGSDRRHPAGAAIGF